MAVRELEHMAELEELELDALEHDEDRLSSSVSYVPLFRTLLFVFFW